MDGSNSASMTPRPSSLSSRVEVGKVGLIAQEMNILHENVERALMTFSKLSDHLNPVLAQVAGLDTRSEGPKNPEELTGVLVADGIHGASSRLAMLVRTIESVTNRLEI